MEDESRPDPDELLRQINISERHHQKGKLKIYIGMCAGVGKTFSMLQDAAKAHGKGIDTLIGFVETHGRAETEFLLFYLPQLPRKIISYKGIELTEFDLDTALEKKPGLVVVDELAHTNAPGSRHNKRYLDVLELLDNGIDVYTALNVQHIESLSDTVSKITGIRINETVPDSILETADEIELVDISPEELLQRLSDGKVYTADKSKEAVENFFRRGNLSALRELSLRLAADRVDRQVRDYMQSNRIQGPWKTAQRILTGISSSPDSAELIRWARRVSYTMDATWIAVHVETPEPVDEKNRVMLNRNIELARELGAEIVVTSDVDIVKGIVRTAKNENATLIVIGKSGEKSFFSRLFVPGTTSRLLKESGSIDVFVVSGSSVNGETGAGFRLPAPQSGIKQYLISAGFVFAVALLCYPLSVYMGYQTVALILLLVVSLLPLIMGPGPVLLAAVISPVIWNYFFVPPRFTFLISRSEDILMFIAFLVIALVTGVLTTRIRQREKVMKQREERAVALYSLANDLSKAEGIPEAVSESVKNIKKVFSADSFILLSESGGKLENTTVTGLSTKELSVAEWVFSNGRKAGRFTDSLPFAEYVYYPLNGPRDTYGVAAVKFKDRNSYLEQESLLENFLKQTGSAVERELLNKKAGRAMILEESEKLYKTLFDSISHELKTPIAAIMGAVSYLLEKENMKDEPVRELYGEINTASERLNTLVGNLLDMARLESGRLIVSLKPCDAGDLANTAVEKSGIKKSVKNIDIVVPEDMPLISADYNLLEQALINILRNADMYTHNGAAVKIEFSFDTSSVSISISDNGPGAPESDIEHIFDKFYRIDRKNTGGTGLGLSITKGIVEAHKGTINALNLKSGGLKFTIKLPR
ncbi:MAG: sensor histidine kinase KdpD [Bacteroidetes bacterium]|nr:sensor histidine kinase KdpD [Bacteroidota bacterium]